MSAQAAPEAQKNLIEIANVNKYYGTNHVLKNINLSVGKGEVVVLLGPSGSGKSTLGKAIMQMLPYQGSIHFDGSDLAALSPARARQLKAERQMVFQDPYGSLSPRLTVGEIIGEGLTVHRPEMTKAQRTELVLKVLDEVSLPADALNRYPHEFSGGDLCKISFPPTTETQKQVFGCFLPQSLLILPKYPLNPPRIPDNKASGPPFRRQQAHLAC